MKLKLVLVIVISLLVGAAGMYLIMPSLNSGSSSIASNEESEQLYTCGMHPDIIETEPGDCPICGMKLVPLKKSSSYKESSGKKEILYWRAPMDPNEIYDEPGKSKMGMDLVPVYADEASSSGVVSIDPVVEQNMNVKKEIVKRRDLSSEVITNGILSTNETKDYVITTRVKGWVQNLYINFTGQKVTKGEKLLDIYSPELVAAQEELLSAVKYKKATSSSALTSITESGNKLVDNAIEKLRLLQIPESDIKKLVESGQIKTEVTLYAPAAGTVIHKNVVEGQKIMPGMDLMKISDLNDLWLYADIYEYELAKVFNGAKADINFNFKPGMTYKGKVDFIYPTIDSKTRTAKVRIDLKNSSSELKPAMLATVKIHGKDLGNYPTVPDQAVIRGGVQDIVVVSLGDGKYKPQPVVLGEYSDGYYQVLQGLKEGTEIVTSAQFLIDSESNLKAAVNKFSSQKADTADAEKMDMGESSNDMSNMRMDKESNEKVESPLVRKGEIDLETVDKNHDGKVYQDQMDWNVISDEPGKCPLCGMTLKELALEDVRNNLLEHGYISKELTKSENEYGVVSPLIRTGLIDLKAIDKNGDGKVYQDFMDWNVISDKPGRCPVCNMVLQEVTLDEAKVNLIEHGYQVK